MKEATDDPSAGARNRLGAAWLIAMVATAGSLFFSDVMGFVPCQLCWYQRIAMYPLSVILLIGILQEDRRAGVYGLALAVPGLLIALYHNLIQWEIIPKGLIPCTQGIPCGTIYINWLGFITIPFLSMMGFAVITGLLFFRKGAS